MGDGAQLRESGVTIILTTHYIEEAEEMADRVGVINKGELIVVEDKATLMRKLGKKQLTLDLPAPLAAVPEGLNGYALDLASRRPSVDLHLRHSGSRNRHRRPAAPARMMSASTSRISTPSNPRSKISS